MKQEETEDYLTEPQRKHFDEKKAQIEAIKTATENEETLKKIALANLTYARDLQGKCNRLYAEKRAAAEERAAAERHNHAAEFSKALGVMVSCYRVIDKWFGDDIREHIAKNDRTQREGQIKKAMAEIERLTKGANNG